MTGELNARVVERTDLCPGLAFLRVAYADGSTLAFEPGQFVELGLLDATGRIERRAYSIASKPGAPALEFLLRRVDDGSLSPRLFDLRPGAELLATTRPLGKFTLADVPPGADVVMIATGTGLGPFLAMIRTHPPGVRWRSLTLLHGVAFEAELAARAELEERARVDPSFRYVPILSRERGARWSGARGRVQELLHPETWDAHAAAPLAPDSTQVLLCGNPAMIVEVTALLEARGFRRHRRSAPGNLRTERYW